MVKFKFRLEVPLKLAISREEEAKKNLASWQNLKAEAEKKLIITEEKIAIMTIEKSKQSLINEILLFEAYINGLRKEKEKISEEIKYFDMKIVEAIRRLQQALKERKILEKLKEKKIEQYNIEQEMIEQKENDDIGTKIFNEGR